MHFSLRRSSALFGIFLILFSLAGCKKRYWKLCNDQCVMHGSSAGAQFDEPCGDVIAVKTNQYKDPDFDFAELQEQYSPTGTYLPLTKISTSIPIHEPIYPMVVGGSSEEVTFKLTPAGDARIEHASLFIR